MAQNYPTLPLVQLPMPKENNLPANLSEILPISQAPAQNSYNPALVRQILSEIQSGKNLGLPELAGGQRNTTLQQLLGQFQKQELPEMNSVYDNGQGQIVQNPMFDLQGKQEDIKNYPTSVGRTIGSGLIGLLLGGPVGAISGSLGSVQLQKQGNIMRDIYKQAGFEIPDNLKPEFVPQFVENQLAVKKEAREQRKADVDILNTTLDTNRKIIEQTTLPEKVKAELKKLQNDAEKAMYEAQVSKSEAKYAEAYQKGRLALQSSQVAANYAIVPYRQAQTQVAQQNAIQKQSQGQLKPLSNEAASGLANSLQGIDATKGMYQLFGKGKELYTNPNLRLTYERQKDAMNDIIRRMRTGAAINAAEEKFYLQQVPTVEDFAMFPQQAQQKMESFNRLFTDKIKAIDPNGTYTQNIRGQSLEQISKPPLTKEQALQLAKQRGLI